MGIYYVTAYGCTGDGMTDDTRGVHRALSSVPAGSTLVFPAGTYLLTAGLTIPSSDFTLCGEGSGTILLARFSGVSRRDFVIRAGHQDRVVVRDLTITGAHAGGVGIQYSTQSQVRRCTISGAVLPNTLNVRTGIYVEDVRELVIDSCHLFGNGDENDATEGNSDIQANTGGAQIVNSRITNNRCLSRHVNTNIALFDPVGVVVDGNEVAGAAESPIDRGRQGYGIMLYHTARMPYASVGRCFVRGNHIHDVRGCGVYMAEIPDSVVSENIVQGTSAGQSDGTLSVAGIVIEGAGTVCANNKVLDSAKCGIQVTLAHRSTITGNTIENTDRDGISVRNATNDLVIQGNTVTNTKGIGIGVFANGPAQRIQVSNNIVRSLEKNERSIGIHAGAASRDWTIANNQVTGANGRGYSIDGGSHLFSGNREEQDLVIEGVSSDRGNSDVTLGPLDKVTQLFDSPISRNRTVTLPSKNALLNQRFRILRTAAATGPGAIDVGGLKSMPGNTAAYLDVEFDAAARSFRVTGYGLL